MALPDPAGTRQAASCTHLRQVCWAAFFRESAGLGAGGRVGGPPRASSGRLPTRSQPAGTACPKAARRRGRGPGARGALPPGRRRSAARPRASGAPRRLAPPRGPSAEGDRPGPPAWPLVVTWLRQSSPLAFASTSTSISTASGLVT